MGHPGRATARRASARWILAGLAALITSGSAEGFGTINSSKQSAEHERITRRAFACDGRVTRARRVSSPRRAAARGRGSDNSCFEPGTLDLLAGKSGDFGAIGYPDGSWNFFHAEAHCDNGDQGGLDACRDWMRSHLDEAVADADGLVDAQGSAIASETVLSCIWAFNRKGKAKCNVLQDMGFVLHAAQDFYAHSNWTDSAQDPDILGLGNTGPSPYISLRSYDPFPAELLSGCYSFWGACDASRPNHDQLNKDLGSIPLSGPIGAGTTSRGMHNHDFQSAVQAAIDDSTDKWALLRERLLATYGPVRGTAMVCALSHDDPGGTC